MSTNEVALGVDTAADVVTHVVDGLNVLLLHVVVVDVVDVVVVSYLDAERSKVFTTIQV